MDNSGAREQILQKIRNGLRKAEFKKIDNENLSSQAIYHTPDKALIDIFEDELTKINGEFILCNNNAELVQKLKEIHAERNLAVCYSPDSNYLEIIKETGIPFIEEFVNEDRIKSGISTCEFLVARFGSVMVSSALAGARRIFSFPEIHIVIAKEDQLVLEIEEALDGISTKYGDNLPSQITNITGPSRTADIEKTLILGAHGPKQLIVMVLKS